jgi:hypothetical protein
MHAESDIRLYLHQVVPAQGLNQGGYKGAGAKISSASSNSVEKARCRELLCGKSKK